VLWLLAARTVSSACVPCRIARNTWLQLSSSKNVLCKVFSLSICTSEEVCSCYPSDRLFVLRDNMFVQIKRACQRTLDAFAQSVASNILYYTNSLKCTYTAKGPQNIQRQAWRGWWPAFPPSRSSFDSKCMELLPSDRVRIYLCFLQSIVVKGSNI
jgi:hypothetical protein